MATREKFRMKKFIVKLSEPPDIRTDVRTAELLAWVSVSNSAGEFWKGGTPVHKAAGLPRRHCRTERNRLQTKAVYQDLFWIT